MNVGILGIALGGIILLMLDSENAALPARIGGYAMIAFFAAAAMAGSKTGMAELLGVSVGDVQTGGFVYLGICAVLLIFGRGARK